MSEGKKYACSYAPTRIEYALNRYTNETRRLYQVCLHATTPMVPILVQMSLLTWALLQVMDSHLADHEWLAANMYSIADIACFSWVYEHAWSGGVLFLT